MKNKKCIIVTGAAGFIGSHIALRLLLAGYNVVILDNLSTGRKENIPQKADFINIDIGNENSYWKLKNIKCKAVFHLAGQACGEASFIDPLYDLNSHIMSTFFLLNWCRDNGTRRFLYASSMATYGEPQYLPIDENHPQQPKTFYAAAKIGAEAYVKLYQTLGIDTTIFRLFSVYGPGQNLENKMQGIVSIYLSYMLEGRPIVVKGSRDRFRDLVYIDDVVNVWIKALNNSKSYGKIYNVASASKTKVRNLLKELKKAFGRPDYPVEYKSGTPGDQFGVVADISLIKSELNWKPKTSLKDGLKKMVEFEKRRLGIAK